MSSLLVKNYRTILGISEDAGINEIKRAYHRKAKTYHPDLNNSPDAHLQFILINEAYTYLLNRKQQAENQQHGSGRVHRPAENSKGFTYEDWLRYERKKARARAAYHSRMRFSEFKKTKIYKTSRVIYALFDIIYFAMGIAILVVPVVYTLLKGIDTRYIGRTIATLIATQIVGTIFIIMIGLSRCEFLRNIFFRKGFTGPK